MNGKDRFITSSGVILTLIALLGALATGQPMPPTSEDDGPDLSGSVLVSEVLREVSEYGDENTQNVHTVDVDASMIMSVKFGLKWADEPADSSRFTNEGDFFSLEVTSPEGQVMSAGPSDIGALEVEFVYPEPRGFSFKGWLVEVTIGDCGDQTPLVSILGVRSRADTGNAYTVDGSVSFYTGRDTPGEGQIAPGGTTEPLKPAGNTPVTTPTIPLSDLSYRSFGTGFQVMGVERR